MIDESSSDLRFFVSYSGVKLPLMLVNGIAPEALSNRNTFIRGYFDSSGVLTGFDKVVYGEVELAHRYKYHPNGALCCAEITMLDDEPVALRFDESCAQISRS